MKKKKLSNDTIFFSYKSEGIKVEHDVFEYSADDKEATAAPANDSTMYIVVFACLNQCRNVVKNCAVLLL